MIRYLNDYLGNKNYFLAGFIAVSIGVTTLLVSACGQISPSSSPSLPPADPSPSVTVAGPVTTSALVTGSTVPVNTKPPTTQLTASIPPAATSVQTLASPSPLPPTQSATPVLTLTPAPSQTQTGIKPRNFEHVFIVVLENGNYSQAIAQPYLKQLAGQGALLSNYYGVAHPSYPNYLALVGGSTFGITSDSQTVLDQSSLVDLMEKAGISWKFYAEQYPENKCFTGTQSGDYARKHLPVLSFKSVQSNPALCSKVVPASQLNKDIAAGTLPNYSFYVPDQKNDGHDTGVDYGSRWLAGFLPGLLNNEGLMAGTMVVVTFDEAELLSSNQIYTALIGPGVKPGTSNNTRYTHYDLLRTIEDNFQLGNLGREDAKASNITGIWQSN